jgi:hypothetical protein
MDLIQIVASLSYLSKFIRNLSVFPTKFITIRKWRQIALARTIKLPIRSKRYHKQKIIEDGRRRHHPTEYS